MTTDEFVMRKEGVIAVIDGNRSEINRRSDPQRREDDGARPDGNVKERRGYNRRRVDMERRVPFKMSTIDCVKGRAGAVVVGIGLIFIGMTLVVMGFTFLPIAGFILSLGAFGFGFFFLFAKNRYGLGMLNKPKCNAIP